MMIGVEWSLILIAAVNAAARVLGRGNRRQLISEYIVKRPPLILNLIRISSGFLSPDVVITYTRQASFCHPPSICHL